MSAEAPATPARDGHASRARLANEAWQALLEAHASRMREFSAATIWDELSLREYDVLYTLARAGGPLSLSELNRHVLLSQPAMSRLVDRLVERGFISRGRDPEDARSVALSLTPAGAELQRQVGRRHGADVAGALGGRLDRDELVTLTELCRRLAGPADAARPGSGR